MGQIYTRSFQFAVTNGRCTETDFVRPTERLLFYSRVEETGLYVCGGGGGC